MNQPGLFFYRTIIPEKHSPVGSPGVYDIIQKRTHQPSLLMDALTDVLPEKIIKINGLDYVSICKVSDLPPSLFKSLNR
jgi:hypothetical protein